ncbi:hypothetical protein Ocin01_11295 [Orchesella cincta]|uniref:Uncharacterized protein n=1 Tax=Orchesella cincta TaxID=48709 RepID=A0A1D2MQP9_ORCCI|nr:hypothetical protein Ocin01_11295 [Orchesella cincta]
MVRVRRNPSTTATSYKNSKSSCNNFSKYGSSRLPSIPEISLTEITPICSNESLGFELGLSEIEELDEENANKVVIAHQSEAQNDRFSTAVISSPQINWTRSINNNTHISRIPHFIHPESNQRYEAVKIEKGVETVVFKAKVGADDKASTSSKGTSSKKRESKTSSSSKSTSEPGKTPKPTKATKSSKHEKIPDKKLEETGEIVDYDQISLDNEVESTNKTRSIGAHRDTIFSKNTETTEGASWFGHDRGFSFDSGYDNPSLNMPNNYAPPYSPFPPDPSYYQFGYPTPPPPPPTYFGPPPFGFGPPAPPPQPLSNNCPCPSSIQNSGMCQEIRINVDKVPPEVTTRKVPCPSGNGTTNPACQQPVSSASAQVCDPLTPVQVTCTPIMCSVIPPNCSNSCNQSSRPSCRCGRFAPIRNPQCTACQRCRVLKYCKSIITVSRKERTSVQMGGGGGGTCDCGSSQNYNGNNNGGGSGGRNNESEYSSKFKDWSKETPDNQKRREGSFGSGKNEGANGSPDNSAGGRDANGNEIGFDQNRRDSNGTGPEGLFGDSNRGTQNPNNFGASGSGESFGKNWSILPDGSIVPNGAGTMGQSESRALGQNVNGTGAMGQNAGTNGAGSNRNLPNNNSGNPNEYVYLLDPNGNLISSSGPGNNANGGNNGVINGTGGPNNGFNNGPYNGYGNELGGPFGNNGYGLVGGPNAGSGPYGPYNGYGNGAGVNLLTGGNGIGGPPNAYGPYGPGGQFPFGGNQIGFGPGGDLRNGYINDPNYRGGPLGYGNRDSLNHKGGIPKVHKSVGPDKFDDGWDWDKDPYPFGTPFKGNRRSADYPGKHGNGQNPGPGHGHDPAKGHPFGPGGPNSNRNPHAGNSNGPGAYHGNPNGPGAYHGNPNGPGAYNGNPNGPGPYHGNPNGPGAYHGNPNGPGANHGHPNSPGAYHGNPNGPGAYHGNPNGPGEVGAPGYGQIPYGNPNGQSPYYGHPNDPNNNRGSPFQNPYTSDPRFQNGSGYPNGMGNNPYHGPQSILGFHPQHPHNGHVHYPSSDRSSNFPSRAGDHPGGHVRGSNDNGHNPTHDKSVGPGPWGPWGRDWPGRGRNPLIAPFKSNSKNKGTNASPSPHAKKIKDGSTGEDDPDRYKSFGSSSGVVYDPNKDGGKIHGKSTKKPSGGSGNKHHGPRASGETDHTSSSSENSTMMLVKTITEVRKSKLMSRDDEESSSPSSSGMSPPSPHPSPVPSPPDSPPKPPKVGAPKKPQARRISDESPPRQKRKSREIHLEDSDSDDSDD